jgi:hypothetical protein
VGIAGIAFQSKPCPAGQPPHRCDNTRYIFLPPQPETAFARASNPITQRNLPTGKCCVTLVRSHHVHANKRSLGRSSPSAYALCTRHCFGIAILPLAVLRFSFLCCYNILWQPTKICPLHDPLHCRYKGNAVVSSLPTRPHFNS